MFESGGDLSVAGVSIAPGRIAMTRTFGASSSDIARVSESTPPFAA